VRSTPIIEESQKLDEKLAILREELLTGNIAGSNESLYMKYFDVRKRAKGKNRVKAKNNAIAINARQSLGKSSKKCQKKSIDKIFPINNFDETLGEVYDDM
jgi:hypothetical protein